MTWRQRIATAWHVLRRGRVPETADAPSAVVAVDLPEVRRLVSLVFVRAGLPAEWPDRATSDDLESAKLAVDVQIRVREQEWANLDAAVNAQTRPVGE